MAKHDEAIQILSTIHRRLIDRLTDAVLEKKQEWLDAPVHHLHTLGRHQTLKEIIGCLESVNKAIAELQRATGLDRREDPRGPQNNKAQPAGRDRAFGRFIRLVALDRTAEASRVLAQLLWMPLDRAITATQFFARTRAADPDRLRRLAELCEQMENAPGTDGGNTLAECMNILMTTFGFQAVEAKTASRMLLARLRGSTDTVTPQAPNHGALRAD